MTVISLDDGPSGLSTSISALQRQLADMQAELQDIYERIKDGEFDQLKNAARATTEIRQWLKIAMEAEVQLERRTKREKGIAYEYAIDFGEARAAVCRQLDRLRRARGAG
ncbi:MAG: hypothetical protein RIG84_00080 [Roseovarius sp.]